jgi:hypothetical protein
MNDAANPRTPIYALLITIAVSSMSARILTAERVLEPSLYKATPEEKKGRKYPDKRPRPMPTFSSNDVSRWATIRALVDGDPALNQPPGTFVIGRRTGPTRDSDRGIITEPGWESVDKVLDPETREFYSSKPPLLSTILAGLYWLLKLLTGWTLADQPFAVVRTIVLFVNAGQFVAYVLLLLRLLERFGVSDWGRYFVLAGACFATLVTPFAVTLNNHSVATFCVMFALYPTIKILDHRAAALAGGERLNGEAAWYLFALAGFFAAFTACNEMPATAFLAGLGAILLWIAPRRTLLFFVPAAAVPLAAYFLTNFLAVGQWQPVQSDFGSPWYVYEGSHWTPPAPGQMKYGIDWASYHETKFEYAFHMLLGHHGLFSLTPLWVLAVLGMLRFSLVDLGRGLTAWRRRAALPADHQAGSLPSHLNLIAGFTAALSVVVVGFYIVKSDNYGGWTCGLRWLMWLTPLWLLCVVPIADGLSRSRGGRLFALACLALSVFSASFPAWNPWRHPWIYQLMEALGWPGYFPSE